MLLWLASAVTLWVPLCAVWLICCEPASFHTCCVTETQSFLWAIYSWELKGNCPSVARELCFLWLSGIYELHWIVKFQSHASLFCTCAFIMWVKQFSSSWHFTAPPSVTSPPEESVQAARGATVTFTCQAVGVPTPIITWRLNWGHIPVSGRWVWWEILHPAGCAVIKTHLKVKLTNSDNMQIYQRLWRMRSKWFWICLELLWMLKIK